MAFVSLPPLANSSIACSVGTTTSSTWRAWAPRSTSRVQDAELPVHGGAKSGNHGAHSDCGALAEFVALRWPSSVSRLSMIFLAYLLNIGRPTSRKAVPKRRPRLVCLKPRAHVISTRDPRGAAAAVMVQLLPGT